MALSQDNVISKMDVINYFNTNVVNVAFNGINYHSGNVPKYTASATCGTQWTSEKNGNSAANEQYTITGGEAIPATQLSNTTKPNLTENDLTGVVTASAMISKMRELAKNCSRIRKSVGNWYHDTAGTYNLVQTLSGKAIYLATTPAVSGTTTPYYTKSPNTTAMTTNSTASAGDIAVDSLVKATSISTFITNLVNEWNTRYNTTVTFNYYTCHSVCHSSCYNRARR